MKKNQLHLEKLSLDNYRQVIKLRVTKEQDNYVARNSTSLIHAFVEMSNDKPVWSNTYKTI